MTGPGEAATTRTSTPKSLSFFSIMREVISSESAVTVSMRPPAVSSRSICGSLVSAMSLNSGFCFSLMMRSDLGTSITGASMTSGIGAWGGRGCGGASSSPVSSRSGGCTGWWRTTSTSRSCARSLAACWPSTWSRCASRWASRRSLSRSPTEPMRSATSSHEKRSAMAMPVTSIAIHSTPEPLNPSHLVLSGPSTRPRMPPACSPAMAGSTRYRRVHSSAQLADSSRATPSQKRQRG